MRIALSLCLVAGLATAACKRTPPRTPAPTPAAATKHAASSSSSAAVREREVRAVLDRWLAAQNEGKLDAYQALYAEKFQGVRRSGPRVRYLNRAGWISDRERMFRKPMKVAVKDLTISLGANAASAHFVQSWESGKYKDEGPKRMQLVHGSTGWLVAQEEMLSSSVAPRRVAGEDYLLVLDGAPVLSAEADESWGDGPRRLDGYAGRQGVRAAALPAPLRRWQGGKLELFDERGRRCTATVADFELVATAEWHFGTVQSWRNGDVSDDEIADEVWEQGAVLLTAKLSGREGDCEQPVFARAAGTQAGPVVPFVAAEDALLTEARKQAEQLLDQPKGSLAELPRVMVARVPGQPARALVFVSIDPEVCTAEASLSAELIWSADLSRRPSLTLLYRGESDFRSPLLASDVDGDGELEIVYSGWPRVRVGVLKLAGDAAETVTSVTIPFYDCPC